MTFADYWRNLEERNPSLRSGDDTTMKISVAAFKVLIRRAFETGEQNGRNQREKLDGLFGQIFGGKT